MPSPKTTDLQETPSQARGAELANLPPNLQHLAFTRHVLIRVTQNFDNGEKKIQSFNVPLETNSNWDSSGIKFKTALLLKGNQNYEIFNTFGSRMYCASVPIKTRGRKMEFFVLNHLGHPCLKMQGYTGCCGRGAVRFRQQYSCAFTKATLVYAALFVGTHSELTR